MSFAVECVAPARWRDACAAELADGGRICGLFADGRGPTGSVRAVFATRGATRLLSTEPRAGILDSIAELTRPVAWDEREASEVHGVRFAGAEPSSPLIDHDTPLGASATPVEGRDVHQVAVGPIHAGVIESGHFRFHVVGERILHLDLRLFYKRRGIEQAAAGRSLTEAPRIARQACGACAVTNSVAAAQAVETALGLMPDRELRRARTVLLELERLYNHLNDVGAICAGVGFAPGAMLYAALKERAQQLNERLTGHRFLFDTVAVARNGVEIGADAARAALDELGALLGEHRAGWRQLRFTPSLRERLAGVGIVDTEAAARLGCVGPAARAAGVRIDVRGESPRLEYPGFRAVTAAGAVGDVAARAEQRALEIGQSVELLRTLLDGGIGSGAAERSREPDGRKLGVARVESPRGETVCAVRLEGDRIGRLWLRTGSYANWPVLAHGAIGELLPEFPLINKSFELCYACVDC